MFVSNQKTAAISGKGQIGYPHYKELFRCHIPHENAIRAFYLLL